MNMNDIRCWLLFFSLIFKFFHLLAQDFDITTMGDLTNNFVSAYQPFLLCNDGLEKLFIVLFGLIYQRLYIMGSLP